MVIRLLLPLAAAAAVLAAHGHPPEPPPPQPTPAEAVDGLEAKFALLRRAFDGDALSLEGYLSAASTGLQDAARRRHGVARAARRMQDQQVPDDMSGQHVRVVTMVDHPFVTLESAEGELPLRYSGFCVEMLDEIARLGNFTYEFVPRTPEQQGNGWAGAVNDVAAGDTDMFWSTFFLTSRRAGLTHVSASWMDTGLQAIALADLKGSEAELGLVDYVIKAVKAPFSPFSTKLWATTLVAMCAYAAIMMTLERPTDLKNMDEEDRHAVPIGLHGVVSAMGNEVYLTFTFMTIGAGREPHTGFGKMLLAVMSFFVLVATSMYTANLATQLLLSAQESTRYTGIDDIIGSGLAVCMPAGTAMVGMLADAYPAAQIELTTR